MARVIVQIETDHEDIDEAARSVSNALKRAGYDVLDIIVEGNSHGRSPFAVREIMHETIMHADPVLVNAAEPETDARFRRDSRPV